MSILEVWGEIGADLPEWAEDLVMAKVSVHMDTGEDEGLDLVEEALTDPSAYLTEGKLVRLGRALQELGESLEEEGRRIALEKVDSGRAMWNYSSDGVLFKFRNSHYRLINRLAKAARPFEEYPELYSVEPIAARMREALPRKDWPNMYEAYTKPTMEARIEREREDSGF